MCAHTEILTSNMNSILIISNMISLIFYIWAFLNCVKSSAHKKRAVMHIYYAHAYNKCLTIYLISICIAYNFVLLNFYIWALLQGVKVCAHKKTSVMCMYIHLKFKQHIWIVFLIVHNIVLLMLLYLITPFWWT